MGRVSLLDLATVARFLKKEGYPPKTQSELLRQGFRLLSKSLSSNQRIETEEEAAGILKEIGITFNRSTNDKDNIDKLTTKIKVNKDES